MKRLNAANLGGRGLADELQRRYGLKLALSRAQGAWTQRLDRFGPAWAAWDKASQILLQRVESKIASQSEGNKE